MAKRDKRRRKKPQTLLKLARERMEMLLDRAVAVHGERPDLSKRYFQLAKKIGMRYNVKLPRGEKRKFCKDCFSLLDKWRFRNGVARAVCGECGRVARYPYKVIKKTRPAS